jgi:hypothetical protein
VLARIVSALDSVASSSCWFLADAADSSAVAKLIVDVPLADPSTSGSSVVVENSSTGGWVMTVSADCFDLNSGIVELGCVTTTSGEGEERSKRGDHQTVQRREFIPTRSCLVMR